MSDTTAPTVQGAHLVGSVNLPSADEVLRTADDLAFPDLGHGAAAIDSFGRFEALQRDGVIPAGTRFQVSLPTPAAVVSVFFAAGDRAVIEAAAG